MAKSAVVIEEWALARLGIGVVLPGAGVQVAASAATATEGFAALRAGGADLMVIGNCPDATTRHAVQRAAAHDVAVVVLLPAAQAGTVLDLCALGAQGVVPRGALEAELAAACTHALAGERYVAPRLLTSAFAPRSHRPALRPRFDLTPRERAVLTELAAGRSNQEIADRLCIGAETVKTHLGNIYAKLSVRRRHHAVGIALQHGLV